MKSVQQMGQIDKGICIELFKNQGSGSRYVSWHHLESRLFYCVKLKDLKKSCVD